MSIFMGICPKCAWFKGRRQCSWCNEKMIVTETTIDDVMQMSEKEQKELIEHYIETLIKDTYDPEARAYREANEESVWAHHVQNNSLSCPYCKSSNVSKISTLNRAFSVSLFGLASSKIGKTHKCNNCGSTW